MSQCQNSKFAFCQTAVLACFKEFMNLCHSGELAGYNLLQMHRLNTDCMEFMWYVSHAIYILRHLMHTQN
jgi:hypothetical protein